HAFVWTCAATSDRRPRTSALEYPLARARQCVNAKIDVLGAPLGALARLDDPDTKIGPRAVEQRGEREPDRAAAAHQHHRLAVVHHRSAGLVAPPSGRPRARRGMRPAMPIV